MQRILVAAALSVTACSSEMRYNVNAMRQNIADMQVQQMHENVSAFRKDLYSLPSQFELQPGSAQTNNAVSTGIAPNIALRAIAITGISLSNVNQSTIQWGVSPVTGVTDLRALQVLYQYAVAGTVVGAGKNMPSGPRADFKSLNDELRQTIYANVERGSESIHFGRVEAINSIVGELPPAPLIATGSDCTVNPTRFNSNGDTACFKADDSLGLSAQAVQARFVLWLTAITQELVVTNKAASVSNTTTERRPSKPPGRQEGNNAPGSTTKTSPPAAVETYSLRRRLDTLVPSPLVNGGVSILP